MGKRRRQQRIVMAAAVALAVLLQAPLLWFLHTQATGGGGIVVPPPRASVRARIVERQPAPPAPTPPDPIPDGQVVTVERPRRERKPREETRHLAQHDVDVKRETRSRERRPPQRDRGGKRAVAKPSTVQSAASRSVEETQLAPKPEEQELARQRPPQELSERGERAVAAEEARGERPRILLPGTDAQSTLRNIQALTGHFTTDDALFDVAEEDDSTLLRARSFRYFDFFDQVKQRVREQWHPAAVYRQRDPTGQIYGRKDRVTLLQVTLDREGNLVKLTTRKKSGLEFLDQEARRAFRAAAPFPNPPAGLVDEDGNVTFRFGFLFELGRARQRFFWQQM